MDKSRPAVARYDPDADVLYLTLRREAATRGVEDERGMVWRYGSDGVLVGVTVIDFRDIWLPQKAALADEISRHSSISFGQASEAIESAVRHRQ
jgi:uncharacterized protein YuzE